MSGLLLQADAVLPMGILVVVGVVCLVILALMIWLVYGTLYKVLKRVPEQYRLMSPGLVFLCLIPLFGMVWLFFVTTRTSGSLEGWFKSQGRTDVGDCARGVGLAWPILSVVSIIPFVGIFTAIAALICMILYLVKVNELKNQIPEGDGSYYQEPQEGQGY